MTVMIPAWIDDRLEPVEKLEVHRRGLRHKAVSVFVMRDGEVLLQKRAEKKYHTPGLWTNTCCTHPDWGETAADCVARRLSEELGIVGLESIHRGRVEYRADVGGGLTEHEVVEIFTAEAPDGLQVHLNPEEVSDVRWTRIGTLRDEIAARPADFTPWLRIYLTQHSDMIFGESVVA